MKNHIAAPTKTPPITARPEQESQITGIPLQSAMPGVTTSGGAFVTVGQSPRSAASGRSNPRLACPSELLVEIHRFRHDMVNQLTVVLGNAELLGLAPGFSTDEERQWLKAITRGAQRIRELTDELLKSARGVNRPSGRKEPVDLRKLLNQAAGMFQALPTGHRLSVIIMEPIPPVPGDAERLRRVMENLVGNAVKYSPAGSAIKLVLLSRADRSLEILVHDEGSGVPVGYREAIFEEGARLPCHAKLPGSGIGLAFCRQVVEEHGGRIWVEENSPHGSVFVVRLPVNESSRINRPPSAGDDEKMAA